MRYTGTTSGLPSRDAILVLTLISHLMLTFGFPLPVSSAEGQTAPGHYHVCGCGTGSECSQGDCCCAPDKKPTRADTDEPSSIRWIGGIFAQKCRGEGAAGLFTFDPAITVEWSSFSLVCESTDTIAEIDMTDIHTPDSPPSPPPRQS